MLAKEIWRIILSESNTPQLKESEIVVSFSGKISTGAYENEQPFFSMKETWSDADDLFIESRQKELYAMCRTRFTEHEKKSIVDRVKNQYQQLRFYTVNNEQYPSVTSIIGWDKDFFIPKEELIQYAARGTIIHKQAENYLMTGEWLEPDKFPEIYPEYVTMTKGSLGLTLDGYNFVGFAEKHPIEAIELETELYNNDLRYAGRCDIKADFWGKRAVMDIKTTSSINKNDCFKQLSAYANAIGNEDVETMVIIPLNSTTKQGFSAPIISDEIGKYFELFKRDRNLFKQRFDV